MANLFEQKERRVIPNWRDFYSTWKLGELDYPGNKIEPPIERNLSIDDYLSAWEKGKSISIAGDLLSAAYVNGFIDNAEVRNVARFLLKNKKKSTTSLNEFARLILSTAADAESSPPPRLKQEFEQARLYSEIRKRKDFIRRHPYNPIPYVDLSRLYAILGLETKSVQNMRIALSLASENRFILRAATRLFAHFDQFDFIYNIIRKSELVITDPWITSVEIALAIILDKGSRYIGTGIQMINSGNYNWHSLTELASSIGTTDFLQGNRKRAVRFLKTALNSPNENTLAQIEWLNSKDLLLDINPRTFKVRNNYEALALSDYFHGRYDSTIVQCKRWLFDLPFSKYPIILGAHVAGSLLDKIDDAIELLKMGLISHPGDAQIINNLAYSYALENRIDDAERYLSQEKNLAHINPNTKICLTATKGLVCFRKGEIAKGNALYQQAITAAKSAKNTYFIWLASLNYAREIILSNATEISSIDGLIAKVPDNAGPPDITKLKNEVITLLKKRKV